MFSQYFGKLSCFWKHAQTNPLNTMISKEYKCYGRINEGRHIILRNNEFDKYSK